MAKPEDIVAAAAKANEELQSFELSPGSRNLLTRAIDNVIGNKGANLTDPTAKLAAESRSMFLEAADGDLAIALDAIAATFDAKNVAAQVFSLLYQLLKAATFIGNLDYRKAMDPTSDFDLHLYAPISTHGEDGKDKYDQDFAQFLVDRREDRSPLEGQAGHPTQMEWQFERMQELYGRGFLVMEDAVVAALQDLQLFFQLTVEGFGWDPNRPLPFLFVSEGIDKDGKPTGNFTPIFSAEEALDTQEIKRQVATKKRAENMAVMRTVAAEAARKRVAEVLAKKHHEA
jgi:hypothetical protein